MPVFSAITVFVALIAVLAMFALASGAWGVDSRPGLGDDHAR